MPEKVQLEIAISGQYLNIQKILKKLEKLSGLVVEKKPITPLHIGVGNVTIVLSILGSLSSIVTLIEYLYNKNKKFEIQIKTKTGEIITLTKKEPWTIEDIEAFLKIEK